MEIILNVIVIGTVLVVLLLLFLKEAKKGKIYAEKIAAEMEREEDELFDDDNCYKERYDNNEE